METIHALSAAERKRVQAYRRREEKLATFEERMRKLWVGHFRRESARIIKAIRKSAQLQAAIPKPVMDAIKISVHAGLAGLAKQLVPVYRQTGQALATDTAMTTGVAFPGFPRATEKWLKSYVPKLTNEISKVSAKRVLDQVTRGIAAGESRNQIAKRIQQLYLNFSQERARRIAQHESALAAAVTENDMWNALPMRDAVTRTWRTARDDRVRDEHRIEGEKRSLKENFSNGLRFPKDPLGSLELTANCRCWLQYVVQ